MSHFKMLQSCLFFNDTPSNAANYELCKKSIFQSVEIKALILLSFLFSWASLSYSSCG